MVPDLQDDPSSAARVEMVVRDYPSSIIAESYRQCYSSLVQPFATSDISSVLIVGGMPESGSSSMASNLALTAVASGQRVALVDANFRRPRIADLFGIDSEEPGFGEVLSGEASLQEVLHETQEGFFVMTAGTAKSLTVERLSTSNFSTAISDLKKSVDVVFIDAPPLVVAGESLTMAGQVDATVLVARAYAEQKGLVARLIHQLSEQRSDFMGVILNRPRTIAGGYFRENFKAMASYAAQGDAAEGEAAA
jgi:capsular exopolysaccharide synthesis family protein